MFTVTPLFVVVSLVIGSTVVWAIVMILRRVPPPSSETPKQLSTSSDGPIQVSEKKRWKQLARSSASRKLSEVRAVFGPALPLTCVGSSSSRKDEYLLSFEYEDLALDIHLHYIGDSDESSSATYERYGYAEWVPVRGQRDRWVEVVSALFGLTQPPVSVGEEDSPWFHDYGSVADERGQAWLAYGFVCGGDSDVEVVILVDESSGQAQLRMGAEEGYWSELLYSMSGWFSDRNVCDYVKLSHVDDSLDLQTWEVFDEELDDFVLYQDGVIFVQHNDDDDTAMIFHKKSSADQSEFVLELEAEDILFTVSDQAHLLLIWTSYDEDEVVVLWDLRANEEHRRFSLSGAEHMETNTVLFDEDGQQFALHRELPRRGEHVGEAFCLEVYDLYGHLSVSSDSVPYDCAERWVGEHILCVEVLDDEHTTSVYHTWDVRSRKWHTLPSDEYVVPGTLERCWFEDYALHFKRYGDVVSWTYPAQDMFCFLPMPGDYNQAFWIQSRYLVLPTLRRVVIDSWTGRSFVLFDTLPVDEDSVCFMEDINEQLVMVSDVDDTYYLARWSTPSDDQSTTPLSGSAW